MNSKFKNPLLSFNLIKEFFFKVQKNLNKKLTGSETLIII